MRHVERGGRYVRVADPEWRDPISGAHARAAGGRWNPPGSFEVVYLNGSLGVAGAQVRRKLEPRGIRPEDLDLDRGPVLVHVDVPADRYVDAVTGRGLESLGLPVSYPLDANGSVIPHDACRPIGQSARDAGEPGIACRSAASTALADGEELAYFGGRPLVRRHTEAFADWFWAPHS